MLQFTCRTNTFSLYIIVSCFDFFLETSNANRFGLAHYPAHRMCACALLHPLVCVVNRDEKCVKSEKIFDPTLTLLKNIKQLIQTF